MLSKIKIHVFQNKKKYVLLVVILIFYYFSLPKTLFNKPYSTVIESEESLLLGAKIASDGQWRFPVGDSVPEKFEKCILMFEDQHFYKHPGFNLISIINAGIENYKSKKIVRGGSTITQQVIRLSRNAQKRSLTEKVIEVMLATRLELRHSKKEILNLYAAHAPFGGNVIGLEMASWRYFGLPSHQLSWAESATLAVLPNAPSLIYPGKNQELLLKKRNKLLKRLFQNQLIDKTSYELALLEQIPSKPFNLPQIAPHFLEFNVKTMGAKRMKTTLQYDLQEQLNEISKQYHHQFKQNEIHNLCILVVDVSTRNVLGYVGNAPTDTEHQKDVDIIHAPRSTGSILKPLLFAAMLDDAMLLPDMLVADIPTQIAGYAPQNFNYTFDGAVPAKRALSRSLNIPAVLMLKDFGVPKFHELLKQFGLSDIKKGPDHYGLSLILGGAESNLWELTQAYVNMASTLDFYTKSKDQYRSREFAQLNYVANQNLDYGTISNNKTKLSAGSIYSTFEAMKEVNRPEGDEAWKFYDSSLEIAWKTGTSFGNRDAWAIGINKKYVVSVWVGNATGEGRPDLTGVSSAAPLLFDVFRLLPKQTWFQKPINDMESMDVCAVSGFLPNENCPVSKQWIPNAAKRASVCPFHKQIHLDPTENFRVNSSCENVENIKSVAWFHLPPVMEWYYKKKYTQYRTLPPIKSNCVENQSPPMDFIYPKENAKIILTKDFSGIIQPIIAKIAHADSKTELFWYVNEKFIGKTSHFHEMSILESSGKFLITVVDEKGFEITRNIEIQND